MKRRKKRGEKRGGKRGLKTWLLLQPSTHFSDPLGV
jgi:hypothetical protein